MSGQAVTFLHLVLAGVTGGLCYDLVRVFRRVIRHSAWLVQLEDGLVWLAFTLFIMLVMLWENNAQLRFFSLLAPILGAALYFCTVSPFIVRALAGVALLFKRVVLCVCKVMLHIILSPFALIWHLVRGLLSVPIAKLKKTLYKFNKIIKKLLKIELKCATIDNVLKGLSKVFYFTRLSFLRANKYDGSDKVEGARQRQENKTK
jgi:spore cortex biosynthesis protein YabQ